MNKSIFFSTTISVVMVFSTLVYTEHPILNPIKFGNNLEESIRGITDIKKTEHLRGGNEDSSIYIIEYSDPTCFFCAHERPILKSLEEKNPDIRFVYRHYNPFNKPEALEISEAIECSAKLGGNDVFWDYIENVFENQSKVDTLYLNTLAISYGLSATDFRKCIDSDETLPLIREQDKEARLLGARGTPYILISKDSEIKKFFYALPEEDIQEIIDDIRK